MGSEKLRDDVTQCTVTSVDLTQLNAITQGNDKPSSKIVAESTIKESKQSMKKEKESEEAVTQNTSMSQVLRDDERKERRRRVSEEKDGRQRVTEETKKKASEAEESESNDSVVSDAVDPKKRGI